MSNNYRAGKLWCSHRMEYYITMKMNRLSLHEATWMYLTNIIKLYKKGKASKSTYYIISMYERYKQANLIHDERGQNRVATSGGTVTRRVQSGLLDADNALFLHRVVLPWLRSLCKVASSCIVNFNEKLTLKILTPNTFITSTYWASTIYQVLAWGRGERRSAPA